VAKPPVCPGKTKTIGGGYAVSLLCWKCGGLFVTRPSTSGLRCSGLLLLVLATALPLFGAGGPRAQTTPPQKAAARLAAHDTPAGELRKALPLLSSSSYSQILDAIEIVAASGAEHAGKILSLISSRKVYVDEAGLSGAYRVGNTYYDLVTAQPLPAKPEGVNDVRVNNRVRNAIKAALGSLRLRAKDPQIRISAADAVMRARDASALPALDNLVETEADPRVAKAFRQTRAALILAEDKRDAKAQLAAIATLLQRADQEAIVALRAAFQSKTEGVGKAATDAVAAIERQLAAVQQVQNIWYGLSLGSVLLLAAIGLAITFGVMGVINMAHGEMVMLGAYTTFIIQEAFRAYAPSWFDLSLLLAIPAAFAVAGMVGIAIERGIIRFLYGRPLETLLATWGVSLILQQAVRTIFGPTNRDVSAPSYMSGGFEFLGLAITYNRFWIILFALVVFAVLLLILRYTTFGLQMRAVTQNRRMAASMGIRTGTVDAMTFGLGSGIAGIAGVALSQIDNVSPNLGQNYIIDSFMVVVFGGVGNLWGTLVSAFSLGVVNKFLEPWAGAVLSKIAILVLLILFIQKRPRGLFALKGRAIEA
jgi:urea transport system permease protein